LRVAYNRRSFLSFALVATASGFGAACGVKGPLYLPQEPETEKEKKKDEEKTSRRESAPGYAIHS
jgi:predicted small lipoprotein YifL